MRHSSLEYINYTEAEGARTFGELFNICIAMGARTNSVLQLTTRSSVCTISASDVVYDRLSPTYMLINSAMPKAPGVKLMSRAIL